MKCCRRIVSILLTVFLLFAVLAPLNAALVNADDALPVITIHDALVAGRQFLVVDGVVDLRGLLVDLNPY